jgi:hypothetical protein
VTVAAPVALPLAEGLAGIISGRLASLFCLGVLIDVFCMGTRSRLREGRPALSALSSLSHRTRRP